MQIAMVQDGRERLIAPNLEINDTVELLHRHIFFSDPPHPIRSLQTGADRLQTGGSHTDSFELAGTPSSFGWEPEVFLGLDA